MDDRTTRARQAAARVGLITLPVGVALTAWPERAARLLRLGGTPAGWRAVGVADLSLVPGLVAGRRRRPWLVGRMGLNLAIAGYAAHGCRHGVRRTPGAAVGVLAMLAATAADAGTLRALATEEASRGPARP